MDFSVTPIGPICDVAGGLQTAATPASRGDETGGVGADPPR